MTQSHFCDCVFFKHELILTNVARIIITELFNDFTARITPEYIQIQVANVSTGEIEGDVTENW